jgi:hypothetical protein
MRAEFRPTGCMRFGLGAFLVFWLCGWAAGEAFALRGLLWSLSGGINSPAAKAASQPMGWVIGGFLLLWTFLWTLGGAAALIHLSRLIAGVDRLMATPVGWELRRTAGLFRRTRTFAISDLRGVYMKRGNGALMLETNDGSVEITSFGTLEERRRAAEEFGAQIPPRPEGELPGGWIAERDVDGLVRVRKAKFEGPGCLAVTLLLALAGILFTILFADEIPRAASIASGVTAALFAALFVWGLFSRREWQVRPGYLARHVRWLNWSRTTPIDPLSVMIERNTDSDGDETARLIGTSNGKPITLISSINDDREIVRLHAALNAMIR